LGKVRVGNQQGGAPGGRPESGDGAADGRGVWEGGGIDHSVGGAKRRGGSGGGAARRR